MARSYARRGLFCSCARARARSVMFVRSVLWESHGVHTRARRASHAFADHRSSSIRMWVSTAPRVFGLWPGRASRARACWVEKGEDRQIGHGPPCHLPGRVVCHPWGRGVVGVRSCARSCPFGAGCEEKPKILLFYASYEIMQKALALASAAHCHARAEPDRPLGGVFNTRGRARPPAAGPSHVDGAA